ncbi:MAG: transcriptional repressor NrdR [Candidatus Magasanikbacteria bacterium]|jgi:transcriptional repressor NrdR|nr:transcriptional repressor NrdR [Candidatus Magasanikbacteria bacterium]MBT4221178.1 transcriptional repressor NrdR [Candidatus Magasanikbacteria bacterium]MBT4350252.1 transcriptional repressor NrdR [Candidatus Magasanikbacteria bacterium]MBT4541679.1 transcriptional repressor NrdR [Candidatus Magasanikbacteria bacterium]MBT6253345.1 transcriptional repressor NrdR [Candidatus Magasanikbacteria bacterium]
MHCPVCRSTITRVVDSRLQQDGMAVRRRRECESCHYRFSTKEETELLDIVVVKNDGVRESYNREKLERGIKQSLVKRPHTQEKFDRLICSIERDIQKRKKREVRSKDLGDIVMKHIRRFDKIAYIRFASIYRAFTDVDGFKQEVQSLKRKKNTTKKKDQKKKKI